VVSNWTTCGSSSAMLSRLVQYFVDEADWKQQGENVLPA
jgi:hypothetical protein